MIDSLELTVVSLLCLAVVFVPLEWAAPAWAGQRRLRSRFLTDLAFFAGQYLLFGASVAFVLARLVVFFADAPLLVTVRQAFTSQPLAIQAVQAVMLGDFVVYWGHRLQHRWDFLWRFHSVHHTAERLDFLAAHREHPFDGLYTQTLMNLPAILLGLSFEGVLGIVAFRSLWAIFIHANVRIPLGPFGLLFGSPALHHWHHARDRMVGNYANLAPWLDRLFGTYCCPHEEPTDLGIRERHPRGYLGLLVHPFLPRR